MKKYKVKAKLSLHTEIPETLHVAIEPENKTMPEGEVKTTIEGKQVVTTVKGTMNVGRLMNTLDDVIKTAILAENVNKQTE